MSASLMLSAQCVLPVLAFILLGIGVRRLGWLDEAGASQMNRLSFRLLLPMVLFKNIYGSDFDAAFDARLILLGVLLTALSFAVAILLATLRQKDGPRRASLAQAIFRNNCVVYGIPIITALYGGGATGVFSMILAFVIPLNNLLAVVLMSLLTSRRVQPRKLVHSVLTNPFVLFAIVGFAVRLSGLTLPSLAVKMVEDISATATPIALMCLGASLRFGSVREEAPDIAFGVACRLVLLPLLFVPPLILAGIREAALVSLFLVVGTPCAVASYVMAQQMGADGELAGHLVVFESLFSVLTIFLALLIFHAAALI